MKEVSIPDKYLTMSFLDDITYIGKYPVDLITVLTRLKMPVFTDMVGSTFWKNNLNEILTAEKITEDFLYKLALLMPDLEESDMRRIKNRLIDLILEPKEAQIFVRALEVLKKHFGKQINLCHINWSYHALYEKHWNDTDYADLLALIATDADIVDTETMNDREIIRLINSSTTIENDIGKIMLNTAYKNARQPVSAVISGLWLINAARRETLTTDEIQTIRDINPTAWITLMYGGAVNSCQTKKIYGKLSQLLRHYRPKNPVILKGGDNQFRHFLYKNIANPAYTDYFSTLLRVGYKFPEIKKKQ